MNYFLNYFSLQNRIILTKKIKNRTSDHVHNASRVHTVVSCNRNQNCCKRKHHQMQLLLCARPRAVSQREIASKPDQDISQPLRQKPNKKHNASTDLDHSSSLSSSMYVCMYYSEQYWVTHFSLTFKLVFYCKPRQSSINNRCKCHCPASIITN